MGIFSGLFRSRDKPQNRTTGSAYSFFFGNSSAGKRVNERSAMQMTAVYSCVRILAEAVAGLPLHLYRYDIVNIGLHFFLKNVRPYATSCSEA